MHPRAQGAEIARAQENRQFVKILRAVQRRVNAEPRETHVRRDETLLVYPEITTINYLTRRQSPSRFTSFMPTETCLFGEQAMLDDLAAKPPDWLLIAPKDMGGMVAESGHGYLDKIIQWIQANYEPVQRICATNSGYTVMAMKRHAHSTP